MSITKNHESHYVTVLDNPRIDNQMVVPLSCKGVSASNKEHLTVEENTVRELQLNLVDADHLSVVWTHCYSVYYRL